MNTHFIESIVIKQFKCFDNFNVKNIGRVNLIGGKNNMGKTSLMEAAYISLQQSKSALRQIAVMRDRRNYLICAHYINIKKISSYVENLFDQEFSIEIKNKGNTKSIDYAYFSKEPASLTKDIDILLKQAKNNINFLSNDISDKKLEELYGVLQEENREDKLNNYISELDPTIRNFKFIQSLPKLQVGKKYIHLSDFGDGIKTYIAIICAIYACKDGQLFIDEIENGLHYSKLDRLWEIILTVSKQQNVQIFATSHSKECIESYARVSKQRLDTEIRFIELGRNKQQAITSISYNFEAFMTEVEQNQEIRGW